jgi:hypothetical protein
MAANAEAMTPMHAAETVSDERVIYSAPKMKDQLRLLVWDPEGVGPKKNPLLFKERTYTSDEAAKSHCQSATLIGGKTVAITGMCQKILLLRDADEFDEVEFLDYRIGDEIRASRDGGRIAFARYPKKDAPAKITRVGLWVYDLKAKRVVLAENIVPLPLVKFAFGLSGDGGDGGGGE